LALVNDIGHLSQAISHATAPAFMPGAVAAFLSILIARLERVADKLRALRTSDASLARLLSTCSTDMADHSL
jgi:hypothetical protein